MKTINYGKNNDIFLYAVMDKEFNTLTPLDKSDLEFIGPDFRINYDSGVYPGITNIEQYICNQVIVNDML
jgi:hypothetical protein